MISAQSYKFPHELAYTPKTKIPKFKVKYDKKTKKALKNIATQTTNDVATQTQTNAIATQTEGGETPAQTFSINTYSPLVQVAPPNSPITPPYVTPILAASPSVYGTASPGSSPTLYQPYESPLTPPYAGLTPSPNTQEQIDVAEVWNGEGIPIRRPRFTRPNRPPPIIIPPVPSRLYPSLPSGSPTGLYPNLPSGSVYNPSTSPSSVGQQIIDDMSNEQMNTRYPRRPRHPEGFYEEPPTPTSSTSSNTNG